MIKSILRSKPSKIIYLVYSWVMVISIWLMSYILTLIVSLGSKHKEYIYNTFCRFTAWLTVRAIGVYVEVEGLENVPKGEPVIFICNHQSFFDIKLVLGFIPGNFCFIFKEEITRIPVVRGYMKTAGHIAMPREEDRRAYATLLKAAKKSREGSSLLVFPEGTRSPDGRLGPFKRGVSVIVLKSGRRVVPMAIIGSRKFLPKESWLCQPEHREMKIKFGKPVSFPSTGKAPREESLEVVERLREEVLRLLGDEGRGTDARTAARESVGEPS